MCVSRLLVAGILLFMAGSTEGWATRTQHAPRPLSAADVEHGLKSAVPNARMASLVKQYGVDFELTHTVASRDMREMRPSLFNAYLNWSPLVAFGSVSSSLRCCASKRPVC